jgi:uncharacterized membrane protein
MSLNIDTGSIVVIIAVLVFYLRMILLQRQRARRIRYERQVYAASAAKARKKGKAPPPPPPASEYSLLSRHPRDRVIGIIGVVLIVLGVFLYSALNPWTQAAEYWWVLLSAGIVLFSWLFQPGARLGGA